MTRLASSRTRTTTSGLALAAILSIGLTAVAQPNEPAPPAPELSEDEKRDQAKAHYLDALEKHKAKQYAAAAEGYLKANELLPKPLFLYNAAVVFRLDGQKEKSLEHYNRYLELEPDGKGSESARKFVAILEKEIAEAKSGGNTGDDGTGNSGNTGNDGTGNTGNGGTGNDGTGNTGDGTGNTGNTGNTGAGSSSDASSDPDAAAPLPIVTRESIAERGSGKRLTGLVMGGVGVVLIGTGVAFGLHSKSLSDEASDYQGPAGPELDDLYRRGDAADRNMVVLLSAGALTAVAGGLVYYLGVRDRDRAERDLEFFVTPTGGGVAGRF